MDETMASAAPRNLGVRALLMLLMAVAFQLTAWVLACVALLQLVFPMAIGGANDRLRKFGASLGLYLAQIAAFESFASEDVPFPFSDWPEAPASV